MSMLCFNNKKFSSSNRLHYFFLNYEFSIYHLIFMCIDYKEIYYIGVLLSVPIDFLFIPN